MMRSVSIVLCCFSLSLLLHAPLLGQNGLKLVGHFDNKHGTTGGVSYSGSWGYVGPDGREYAILGTATGTAIIEITDTLNIHEIAHIAGPTSIWREMRTYRNRLYIVSEGGNGTTIVDLSGLPAGVRVVKNFVYTSGTKNTLRSHTIEIFDGYMYLNGCANWGSTTAQRGTVIFSLADPDNPAFVGEYSPNYFHDSYVRGNMFFGASVYNGGGIYIADIQNKSAPVAIGKISYAGSGTHNVWTTKDGAYVISSDEIGSTPKTLKFWDLQSLPTIPSAPSATFQVSPLDIEHNVIVRGDYAYTAWYTAGIVVADVHSPTSPTTAGFYDTSIDSLYAPGSYNGVWAVYPYFWSGKVTAGDMQNGLYVFTFDQLAARTPMALSAPADQMVHCDQSPIQFHWTRVADAVEDPHTYLLALKGPGLDTLIDAGTDTTYTLSNPQALQGGTFTWCVLTKDEVNVISSQDTFAFVRPTPHVLSPNGGDLLKVHAQVDLHWSWSCSDSVELGYSTDNGASWTPIATIPASETTYQWTVPIAPTMQGRLRVRDAVDPNRFDLSDSVFGIFNSASVALTIPNGGEEWKPGEVHQIAWSSVFVDSVVLDYSTDNGSTWQPISTGAPAAGGSFLWSPPVVSTYGALVKIVDKSNMTVLDQSDGAFTISPFTVAVTPEWNLVSLPVNPSDHSATTNFPGARSFLFRYEGSYLHTDSVGKGVGYWIKYDSARTIFAVGSPFQEDTIPVKAQWNLVGAPTTPVAVSSIDPSSGTMLLSPYYRYDPLNGYEITDSLHPGQGYWVKSSENGLLYVNGGPVAAPGTRPGEVHTDLSRWSSLTFESANGQRRTLYYSEEELPSGMIEAYALPPAAPAGSFDARYASGRLIEHLASEREVLLTSAQFPLTIRWNILRHTIRPAIIIDGAAIPMTSAGSIRINQAVSRLALGIASSASPDQPTEFHLHQNYPNPFNPATTIRFDLPEAAVVTLKVYNVLNQEIATVVNHERRDAGVHVVKFTGEGLPSGVYFYRILAERTPESIGGQLREQTSFRKMILMK